MKPYEPYDGMHCTELIPSISEVWGEPRKEDLALENLSILSSK